MSSDAHKRRLKIEKDHLLTKINSDILSNAEKSKFILRYHDKRIDKKDDQVYKWKGLSTINKINNISSIIIHYHIVI